MAERIRAWLIANPQAGRKAGVTTTAAGPDEARAALERHGVVVVEARTTEGEGDATALARQAAAAGAELVVAAGGDGTVHEAAAGLVSTATTLGVLPLGSMMNIARALNIPRDLDGAAAVIRDGQRVRMDVGKAVTPAAERYFLEVAGVGIDAGVFVYADQLDDGDWGSLLKMLRFVARYRPRPVRLTVDGQAEVVPACLMISVAIGPFAGAGVALAPDAKVDDRQFDVVVRERFSRLELARHLAASSWGRRAYHPKARTLRGSHVAVEAVGRRLMVHADGSLVGPTPARFELLPAALSVLVGQPPATEPSAVSAVDSAAAAPTGARA
jgi:YegS/Rv2252/BmrU family lipid kinase